MKKKAFLLKYKTGVITSINGEYYKEREITYMLVHAYSDIEAVNKLNDMRQSAARSLGVKADHLQLAKVLSDSRHFVVNCTIH